jgi:alpha-glucuronidase
MQGNKQVVAVGQDGLIQGYTSNELLDLNKKKIDLVNKLTELEEKKQNLKAKTPGAMEAPPTEEDVIITVVPIIEQKNCQLKIKLSKAGWIIRSVILFSDTLFKGGSFAIYPPESTS